MCFIGTPREDIQANKNFTVSQEDIEILYALDLAEQHEQQAQAAISSSDIDLSCDEEMFESDIESSASEIDFDLGDIFRRISISEVIMREELFADYSCVNYVHLSTILAEYSDDFYSNGPEYVCSACLDQESVYSIAQQFCAIYSIHEFVYQFHTNPMHFACISCSKFIFDVDFDFIPPCCEARYFDICHDLHHGRVHAARYLSPIN